MQDGNNKIPELQIWRKQSSTNTRYSKIHHTQEAAVVTLEQPNLYAMSVSWQVEPGDVFGVYQPRRSGYSFAMQERGGEGSSYVLRNKRRAPDRFDTSNYDASDYPYPLVNLEAGRCNLHRAVFNAYYGNYCHCQFCLQSMENVLLNISVCSQ